MEGVHQTRNRSNTFMDAVPERAMNPVTGAQPRMQRMFLME